MRKFALLAVVPFFLVGCSNNADAPKETGRNLDGDYTIGYVQVDGKPLRCVEMKRGAGNTQWGGLSCDWVTFNEVPHN